jgi:hypothetical protein
VGQYLSEKEYVPIKDALIRAIPATISADHREALKSKIRFGYEFSLRKRLAQVVSRLDPIVARKILGESGAVPSSWVHTRNYYTHWDDASREDALSGMEMHRASVRLRHLLRVLYLDFIGIPTTAIAKALDGAFAESQYLIQLNNAARRASDPAARVTPLMTVEVRDAASPDPEAG